MNFLFIFHDKLTNELNVIKRNMVTRLSLSAQASSQTAFYIRRNQMKDYFSSF